MGIIDGFSSRVSRVADSFEIQTQAYNAFIGTRKSTLVCSDEILDTARSTSECVDKIFDGVMEKYISGIKDPIFSSVEAWISDGGSFFTLFGRMGTGKSFFAARLSDSLKNGSDVIYYSAHKLHAETTVLKNMLYTVAYKLVNISDSRVTNRLGNHPLPTDIDLLTEDIFIKSFESLDLQREVVFILDGLDEYSREDCCTFLHALSSRKARISDKVKIFFTGRPEEYLKEYLPHDKDSNHYEIESHAECAILDCVKFIDEKSHENHLHITDECKNKLIEKGEYSLNYLDLFIEEHKNHGELSDFSEIERAPKSLYDYYNLQLHRYFTEAGKLEFYKSELKPIIAALTAEKRPLTEDDVCIIANVNRIKLSEIIDESAPLLVVRDGCVSFYQDVMKEFFTSSACAIDYRIKGGEGDLAIANAVGSLIMRDRFKRAEYFRLYAHEHLIAAIDNDPMNDALWDSLISIFKKFITSFSIVGRVAKYILSNPIFLKLFFNELTSSSSRISPILRERIFTTFLAISFGNDTWRKDYTEVLRSLSKATFYRFHHKIAESRTERFINKNIPAAKELAEDALYLAGASSDELLILSRSIFANDEIVKNAIDLKESWEKVADLFEKILSDEKSLDRHLLMDGDLSIAIKRDLSVTYDRIGKWLLDYDPIIRDPEQRAALLKRTSEMLGAGQSETFSSLAVEALSLELQLAEECNDYEEFDSAERLADLLPAQKRISRIASSRPDQRDDRQTALYARRVADIYVRLYKLAPMREGKLGKNAAIEDAIGFLHAISINYKSLGVGDKALYYAQAAVDFAKRIIDIDKGEGESNSASTYARAPRNNAAPQNADSHTEYCYGIALCHLARTLASFGGITDEAINAYGDAITHFNLAYELCPSEELYAKAAALVSGEIATRYTREDMHKEAISYRCAAITRLNEIISSTAYPDTSIYDEFYGQKICLLVNKVFASGFEIASKSDALELITALKHLSSGSRNPEAESYISVGFILAHVFAVIINTDEMFDLLNALREDLVNSEYRDAIGGACEKAFSLKFMAEVAMKRGESPDRLTELYEVAITEFRNNSTPDSSDEILLSPASCYRSIADAYRMAEDWAMAKKYAALEINELNLLTATSGGERFLVYLAECYYRYAIILECMEADEDCCNHDSDSAVDFYITALKLCTDGRVAPSNDSASVLVDCLNELYGIVREDYDAMQELIENGENQDYIQIFVNEGLRIGNEIFDFLSVSAQSDLADIMKQFRDYLL